MSRTIIGTLSSEDSTQIEDTGRASDWVEFREFRRLVATFEGGRRPSEQARFRKGKGLKGGHRKASPLCALGNTGPENTP